MTVRTSITQGMKRLGSAAITVNSAATTNFDFGTPNDLDLLDNANYRPGDRILVVFSATTGGTTDTLAFSVQDADDNAGSFGTAATAVTSAISGESLAAATGNRYVAVDVTPQSGRPWLRMRATGVGATDTFVCHCSVFAIPQALV